MVVIKWTNDVGVVSAAICNGIGQTLQFLTPLSVHVHVQLLQILVLQRKKHECRVSPSWWIFKSFTVPQERAFPTTSFLPKKFLLSFEYFNSLLLSVRFNPSVWNVSRMRSNILWEQHNFMRIKLFDYFTFRNIFLNLFFQEVRKFCANFSFYSDLIKSGFNSSNSRLQICLQKIYKKMILTQATQNELS